MHRFSVTRRATLIVPQISKSENNKRFERQFDQAYFSGAGYLSPAIEVLLVRGIGAMVTVYVRLSATTSVPVGFVLLDPKVVAALDKSLRLDDVFGGTPIWRRKLDYDEESASTEIAT